MGDVFFHLPLYCLTGTWVGTERRFWIRQSGGPWASLQGMRVAHDSRRTIGAFTDGRGGDEVARGHAALSVVVILDAGEHAIVVAVDGDAAAELLAQGARHVRQSVCLGVGRRDARLRQPAVRRQALEDVDDRLEEGADIFLS